MPGALFGVAAELRAMGVARWGARPAAGPWAWGEGRLAG